MRTCPIPNSEGHVPPSGPPDSNLLFIAEAAGTVESIKGYPLCGPSGQEFDRWLMQLNLNRDQQRVGNVIECHPPYDYLVGAPWEQEAYQHCRPALDSLLQEPHRVVVTLGGTALKQVLGLTIGSRNQKDSDGGVRVQDFHGSPVRSRDGRLWVVPTFHPSHIINGNQKLRKTVKFDLERALECLDPAWTPNTPELIIDPPLDWFESWASAFMARRHELWLAVDIETPDKGKKSDEGELSKEDASYEILRINFSCSPDQGITVPWLGPYITIIKRVLEQAPLQTYWNATYDVPRLRKAGLNIPWGSVYDFMDGWHVIQSALPRGLGFVSSFYSTAGPWKHLGNSNLTYCAVDGVQTLRCTLGIEKTLKSNGMWPIFINHHHKLDELVLRPAEEVGLPIPKDSLLDFKEVVSQAQYTALSKIRTMIPLEAQPLDGPYVKRPAEGDIVERGEAGEVRVCLTCKEEKVHVKHKCKGWICADCGIIQPKKPTKKTQPDCGHITWTKPLSNLSMRQQGVIRYYKRLPFNPASPDQVKEYCRIKKYKLGVHRKTRKETTDKKTLNRLIKTGDPVFPLLLEHRQASKMKGTYAEGLLDKLDINDRVHGTMIHGTSTGRLSSKDPNLQNLASHVNFAKEFRKCVQAQPGCRLVSVDFAGIEAVLTGYFSGDPQYIRLATMGVHAYLTSFLTGEPADLGWPDSDLKPYLDSMKSKHKEDGQYDKAKRTVHGVNYGLTEYGLVETFPELFPTKAEAKKVIDTYLEVCPSLAPWQKRIRMRAHEVGYLGGPKLTEGAWAHPFGYRHQFYNVVNWRKEGGKWKERLGEDAKRAVAFFPQSTAAGVQFEAVLRLFNPDHPSYIGDAFFGKTPLRALIHDEVFMEVQDDRVEEVIHKTVTEMTRPIPELTLPREWGMGPWLKIGVAVKVGRNWAPWSDNAKSPNPHGMLEVDGGVNEVAADVFKPEEEEEEDAA